MRCDSVTLAYFSHSNDFDINLQGKEHGIHSAFRLWMISYNIFSGMARRSAGLDQYKTMNMKSLVQFFRQGRTFCWVDCLFDLILYVLSTIFQLYSDESSWVEPVLS